MLNAELFDVELWASARSSVLHPLRAPEWQSLPSTWNSNQYSVTIPANSRDPKNFSAFCTGVRQVSNATESSHGSVVPESLSSSTAPEARSGRKQNEQTEADSTHSGSAGRNSAGSRRNPITGASSDEEARSESEWRQELRGRSSRRAVRESEPQDSDIRDSDTRVRKGAPIGLDKFASEWEPDLHSPDWLRVPPPEIDPEIDHSDPDSKVQELAGIVTEY